MSSNREDQLVRSVSPTASFPCALSPFPQLCMLSHMKGHYFNLSSQLPSDFLINNPFSFPATFLDEASASQTLSGLFPVTMPGSGLLIPRFSLARVGKNVRETAWNSQVFNKGWFFLPSLLGTVKECRQDMALAFRKLLLTIQFS